MEPIQMNESDYRQMIRKRVIKMIKDNPLWLRNNYPAMFKYIVTDIRGVQKKEGTRDDVIRLSPDDVEFLMYDAKPKNLMWCLLEREMVLKIPTDISTYITPDVLMKSLDQRQEARFVMLEKEKEREFTAKLERRAAKREKRNPINSESEEDE